MKNIFRYLYNMLSTAGVELVCITLALSAATAIGRGDAGGVEYIALIGYAAYALIRSAVFAHVQSSFQAQKFDLLAQLEHAENFAEGEQKMRVREAGEFLSEKRDLAMQIQLAQIEIQQKNARLQAALSELNALKGQKTAPQRRLAQNRYNLPNDSQILITRQNLTQSDTEQGDTAPSDLKAILKKVDQALNGD